MKRGNSPISACFSRFFAVLAAILAFSSSFLRVFRPVSRRFGRKVSAAGRGEEPYLGLFNSVALIVSLAGSAYLTVEAAGGRGPAAAAWCALIPIFVSVLVLTPIRATAGGVFWGASVFAFHALVAARGGEAAVALTLKTLVVLAALPGVYAGAASWLTRRIGFSPLVVALGWLGLTFAFGQQESGFVDPSHSIIDGLATVWVTETLGTVCLAFLAAYVCALIVLATDLIVAEILGWRQRLSADRVRPVQLFELELGFVLRLLRQCLPRAPPKACAA